MRKILKVLILLIISFVLCSCDNQEVFLINYDLNGGICSNLITEFNYDEKVILPFPEKEGYIFIGWFDKTTNEEIKEITNKDYNLVALWDNIYYKINYDLDGGTCSNLITKFNYDDEVTLPLPEKEGYIFVGWFDKMTNEEVKEITNKDYDLVALWEVKEIFTLVVDTSKIKKNYYIDDNINLDELIVTLKSPINNYIVEDYLLDYEVKLGEVNVNVSYKEYQTSFIINIIEREKEKLDFYYDFSDKTTENIDYMNYIGIIDDVRYSSSRGANMIIAYDAENFVKTNIYGYELSIDEYGKIVDKNINVSLVNNGMVISAHGNRIADIKNLNVGDYVLLLNNFLYVYDGNKVSKANDIFLKFNELVTDLNSINSNKAYNELVYKLNSIIPLLNDIYDNYDDNLYNIIKTKLEAIDMPNDYIDNHDHEYSYNENTYCTYSISNNNQSNFFLLHAKYDDILYKGGFRNSNSIHYYDESCYRERNAYGYEVAVDKDGYVIDKDVLVNLPEGGFILSGHTSGSSFINNYINLHDKIVLTDDSFEVYRDNMYIIKNSTYELVNELILKVNNAKENSIPHDYNFIDKILKLIDNEINNLDFDKSSLYNVMNQQEKFDLIKYYISICYGQLIDYSEYKSRGIWYYPFSKLDVYNDKSIEGVKETLLKFKKMGINEIIINPFYGNYSLFENSIYEKSEVLNDCDYGEYGKDYLMCFIEEAHKLGIYVNAFTQTFANNSISFKNKDNKYYQIDYNGEKSLGSIYYYDICNDDLQAILLTWYKELVSKYNFDKIEYDIIRYPQSNLYKYLEEDVLNSDIEIIDHGYTDYSINKFMTQYGYIGDLKELIRNSKDVRRNWMKFKEDELISFITKCSEMIKKINPEINITAAVLNDYESACSAYLQDAKKWLELGIVDEIEPMAYTVSVDKVESIIEYYNNLISSYSFRAGISPRLTLRDSIIDFKQIQLSMNNEGYVLFSNNLYYDIEFVNILSMSYHKVNGNDKLSIICDELINKINGYYKFKNNNDYQEIIRLLEEKEINNAIEEISKVDNIGMKNYILNILNKISN